MKKNDLIYLGFLVLTAVFIWVRTTLWMTAAEDTLPILVALPVFIWLGWPWTFREEEDRLPIREIGFALLIFLLGIISDLTIILAIAWTYLLWIWLKTRLVKSELSKTKKLLILPIMAFPWITLDMVFLGWWFRLTGAIAAAALFSFLGADVSREGTMLLINKIPISIEAACSGMNTLQSMLIAGTALAYIFLGNSSRYWWNLPLLVVVAWIANTIRVIVLIFAALMVSPSFALGAFHDWGGWLVLMVMFGICGLIFYLQETQPQHEDSSHL